MVDNLLNIIVLSFPESITYQELMISEQNPYSALITSEKFKIAFTNVFGTQSIQKEDHNDLSFFTSIKRFLTCFSHFDESILKNSQEALPHLKERVKSINQSNIVNYYLFGCSLIFEKTKKEAYTKIYLVANESWALDLKIQSLGTEFFPTPLPEFKILTIGEITQSKPLEIVSQEFLDLLNEVYQFQFEKKAKIHKTPSWIYEFVKATLEYYEYPPKEEELPVIFSKGGTLDVGRHTGITQPDTVWCVSWAVWYFYLKDLELIKVLMTVFKCELLKSEMSNKILELKKSDDYKIRKKLIVDYQKCLQDLRGEFISLHLHNNPYFDYSKSCENVAKINGMISELDFACEERCFKWEVTGKMEFEENFRLNVSSLCPKKSSEKTNLEENMKNLSKSFCVSFEDMIEKLIKTYEYKNEIWALAVEDCIFTFVFNELTKEKPFHELSGALLQNYEHSSSHESKLKNLLIKYESFILKPNPKSDEMGCQLHSHHELMKVLICVIGFEVFKRENQQTIFEIEEYRVPINIEKLYDNFNSLSHKARKVVEKLFRYHNKNISKTQFFSQDIGYNNYRPYAQRVSRESDIIQNSFKERMKRLESQKQKLKLKISSYHKEYEVHEKELNGLKEKKKTNCSCTRRYYEVMEYHYGKRKNVSKSEWVTCRNCERYEEKSKELKDFEEKTEANILTEVPGNDGEIHEFFYCLGKFDELLGLLNLVLICQHKGEQSFSSIKHAEQIFSNGLLKVECAKGKHSTFHLINSSEDEIESHVINAGDEIFMIWNTNKTPTISYDLMSEREKKDTSSANPYQKTSIFLDNPGEPPKDTREHRIYATLYNRPSNLMAEEYIAVGSCLTGLYTEIPVALEHIEKRHVRFDTLSTSYLFQKLVFFRSLSRIKSMIPMNTTDELEKNVVEGGIFFMKAFLNKYHEKWTSQDFSSLIVVGPIISLLIKTLEDHNKEKLELIFTDQQEKTEKSEFSEILTKVTNKLNFEYNRLEEDCILNSGESAEYLSENKANQCFISFAVICCFTENVISYNDSIAVEFVKMIVIFRFKEIYLEAPKNSVSYEKTITQYSFLKNRAEEMNMRKVLMYFINNPKDLTKVVKIVDDVIDKETNWIKDNNGEYLFRGNDRFENTYKIDIKHGKVIKNGQTVSRIPEIFKKLEQFEKIFGKRDFEVYPAAKGNSFITKRNFSDLLEGSIAPEDVVLFEFGFAGEKPIINMIVRNSKEGIEKSWRLLETNEILKEVPIPKLFTESSFAWYCESLHCIVFRRINLANIGEIVLIVFLNNETTERDQKITKISIVSRQHEKSSLSKLCNPHNNIFNKLIVRKENNSKAFEVLSRIESKDFILEVESVEENRRKFFLHRFDLFFVQHETLGLLPENFKFYRLAENAYSHKNIPWTEDDKIPCLVFEKYAHNEMTQQSHTIKLLIPQELVDFSGTVKICDKTNFKRKIFFFDVHDHFRDIRGPDRVSQLHLASILCAVNKNISNDVSKMTQLQYAIKVVKSCFGNIPLDVHEMEEVFNLSEIAVHIESETMVLMCYGLLQSTKEIRQIKEETDTEEMDYYRKRNTKIFRETVSNTMNKYSWKLEEKRIPYREILPPEVAEIIGLKYEEKNEFSTKKYVSWKNESKLKVDFLKYGLSNNIENWKENLQEWTSLNKEVMKETIVSKEKVEQEFPLMIENKRMSKLFKEVIEELEESYKTYIRTKTHYDKIEIQTILMEQKFKNIKEKMEKAKVEIEKVLESVSMEIQNHIDFQSGISTTFGRFDFVDILIKENNVSSENDYSILTGEFLQKIENDIDSTQNVLEIISTIKIWILYCVKIDSCNRILHILNCKEENEKIDKVALFRECESPRPQIEKKNYWICFEAELKLQIWKSQYETFETLMMKNKSGTAMQLNMGEGKTQTIIPLMILELIYNKNLQNYEIFKKYKTDGKKVKKVPRVNLMEALINESKLNYFKILSITAFNIPLCILPFNRTINLANQECLNAVSRSLNFYKEKMILILDQSSTHSLILKLREESLRLENTTEFNKENTIFSGIDTFDIFDEVDAQLTPKKSFIYSVGEHNILDSCKFRTEIGEKILESICKCVNFLNQKSLFAFDETILNVQASLDMFQFPKGLRLLSDSVESKDKRRNFRSNILSVLLKEVECNLFSFLETLSKSEMDSVEKYLIEEEMNVESLKGSFTDSAKSILFILRGYLAYGVLEHCLSLRCNVNYGIPDKQRKKNKRVAIPYEAADIPSKKNDYAHPEVAILLSYLSYYNFGLTEEEVLEGFETLFIVTGENEAARENYFKEWLNTLAASEKSKLQIENTLEIKLHSLSQRKKLFEVFRFNRKFIAYWLKFCVFEKDTAQFESSITSSSWDHANVRSLVGFSGTKDNCKLLPTYVKLINSESEVIMGTDGRMLDLFIENTLEVIDVENSNEPLWERFLNSIFSLPENYNISSIIDAGAILASKSLKDFIVPWISKKETNNFSKKFMGISFCSEDSWKVFKLSSEEFIQRGSSISDSETFVIFDESRTRGADLKMRANIGAVLTLSPNLTKDNLMQAVGRLRKLGRNQKIVVILTEEVKMKISKEVCFDEKMTTKEKAKAILSWCCINSVDENEKMLAPNAKLAAIHFQNLQNEKVPFKNTSNTTVKSMYQEPVAEKTILETCEMNLAGISKIKFSEAKELKIKQLKSIFKKYGEKTRVKAQNFNEICEWQSEIVTETVEEKEIEGRDLNELPEEDDINYSELSSLIEFKFSERFKITDNFYKVSKSFITSSQSNELMTSHFIYLGPESFIMITQREVDILLKQSYSFYKPETNNFKSSFIARYSDISIDDPYIVNNDLVEAFVQCKFFNGVSEFENQREFEIIRNLILLEEKRDEKAKYFLMRRRQIYKFSLSSLERILKDLCLISVDQINKLEGNACE